MSLRRSTGQIQRKYGKSLAAVDTLGAGRNLLLNGCFRVAQQGTTWTSSTTAGIINNDDGNYLLDQWILLSDGDDVVDVLQETSVVPDDAYAAIRFEVETTNKKFGILQILENRDIQHLIGDVCSLSFEARIDGASLSHLRAAVISCDATADTVTSDVVSSWGAAGADPVLINNGETWTYEGTQENLTTLTTSYQRLAIENIEIDTAGTNNIAVFIWLDDVTTTLDHKLYISKVQLEAGRFATPFEHRSFASELQSCMRYFEKSFPYSVTPVQQVADFIGAFYTVASSGLGGGIDYLWKFKVDKRIAPTMAYYNPNNTDDKWDCDNGDSQAITHLTNTGPTETWITADENNHDVLDDCWVHAVADARL